MEYKGIEFKIVQRIEHPYWKWIVRLDENRSQTGGAYSRVAAIRLAQVTIDKAIKLKSLPPRRPK